jgi:RNA-directed DNA polymerase
MNKAILRKWLNAGFIDKQIFYSTEAGTPQGGVASPTLANLTLNGLEALLNKRFADTVRRAKRNKVHLVRYCDDFIITAASKEMLEKEVQPLVEEFLHTRGLRLSAEKTKITHIEEGFDFLGQNVRKYNGKLLIKPSAKNIKTFLAKVRGIIKINKPATAGEVVVKLNPVIKGWANYHRHVVSKRIFSRVDCAIFKCLWQWAKRSHPNKSHHWIGEKYFHKLNSIGWNFFGEVAGKKGERYNLSLFKASNVPITRHVKIKGEANPYDANWEIYFEKRLGVQMVDRLKGRRKLIYLWKQQGGKCLICKQTITEISGWHCHHLIKRVDGGSDKIDNLVLLHPNCHNLVHNLKLSVVKPRPVEGR